jgi:hypothetical protein
MYLNFYDNISPLTRSRRSRKRQDIPMKSNMISCKIVAKSEELTMCVCVCVCVQVIFLEILREYKMQRT